MINYYITGGVIGFIAFLYETTTIGNTYVREDNQKRKVMTSKGLVALLKSPFTKQYYSIAAHIVMSCRNDKKLLYKNLHLLRLNWIFMVLVGAIGMRLVGPILL